jgi:hypothetical protein
VSRNISNAVQLSLTAYELAWKYCCSVHKQWEPRAEELRQLDEFHRTSIAFENADARADWLCEECAHVLLRAASKRKPIPPDRFRLEVFQKCRNRLWLVSTSTTSK